MKKALLLASALCIATVSVFAQQQHAHDPDKMAAGSGTLPAGWKGRLDNGSTTTTGVNMMAMGQGLHVTTGPAGIYFRGADKPATGPYEAQATFTQLKPAAHPEAYGLFIGGSDLEGAAQKYTYFLVRQDGQFMVRRRNGSETPTIANWTANDAIKKADASGKMTNALSIVVGADKVRFLVNGTEVLATDAAKVDAHGVAGLRVNHNLEVMVDGFAVKTH